MEDTRLRQSAHIEGVTGGCRSDRETISATGLQAVRRVGEGSMRFHLGTPSAERRSGIWDFRSSGVLPA